MDNNIWFLSTTSFCSRYLFPLCVRLIARLCDLLQNYYHHSSLPFMHFEYITKVSFISLTRTSQLIMAGKWPLVDGPECSLVGLPRCKNLWHFFFVLLARSGVWLLFNGLWALLFSLFYVIREFDKMSQSCWVCWSLY